jgi:hypothetical protein
MPAPQRLGADLVEEGPTIPVARVQAMHEGQSGVPAPGEADMDGADMDDPVRTVLDAIERQDRANKEVLQPYLHWTQDGTTTRGRTKVLTRLAARRRRDHRPRTSSATGRSTAGPSDSSHTSAR